ncbi:MAG: protein-glutamate O-methyltransferase CheR [Gammaproteobacteria bacterium]|nr:protein-glutamate O-methyltransferase CheR [Gammaproteobacteria bacterium]
MVISADDYQAFQKLLHEKSGILLGENKQYLVSSRLSSFLKEQNLTDLSALLKALTRPGNDKLLQQVIDRMTTNETLWFRDGFPFDFLINTILPEQKANNKNNINIWCAACSSGQEPYSITIALDEASRSANRHKMPMSVDIVATDISSRILEQARNAEYQSLEITRGLTPQRQSAHFDLQADGTYQLKPHLKKNVRFSTLNLMQTPYRLGGQYDVVFCRNVLIYFASDLKIKVINSIADCLKPGGYLFLGASESMPSSIERFEMVRCNPGLVYRKRP